MLIKDKIYQLFFWSAIPGYYLLLSIAILFNIESRLITIPIRIIPIFLIFGIMQLVKKQKIKYKELNFILLIVFSVFYSFRIIYNGLVEDSLVWNSWDEYFLYFLITFFLPTLISCRFNTALLSLNVEKTFFYGLLALNLFFSIFYYDKLGTGRIRGVEDGSLSVLAIGYCSALMIVISLNNFLKGNKQNCFAPPLWVIILSIFSSIIPLVLSASRGPALAILISAMIIFGFSKGKYKIVKILILTTVIMAFSGKFIDFVNQSGSSLFDRLGSIEQDINNDSSSVIRLHFWKEGINDFLANPFLGKSIELSNGAQAHNIFIEAYMATGMIGGSIFIYLIIYALYQSIKALSNPKLSWMSSLYFVSLNMYSVSGAIHGAIWLALPLGIFIGISNNAKQH